ncbi:Crp/Fnr family transcriptional regulator [Flavobacterium xinjiangense]|uniref:cAMP-binding domain of CRP or a regulatory subunit of cAMP-dependent protein kinases n=1 Tax=Flavobacterium xinjiangense TaxID=178356 RepID=A0A1M7P9M3_9FLAO|nr:Crp/Fnr family transcriptional regulator [Flavobacterium xinjiangense]SHN13466.1 cAMP-binding domain of CRP or a regulatory subunit of cAMP-dependent protein kinases [Flavobacterium xinjiangense]
MENSLNKEHIIKNISQTYTKLTDNTISDYIRVSKIFTLDKSTLLVKEGQNADKIYFIANGSARAYYLKDGKEITDWFAFENDFISSIGSFFENIPSPHFIELLETTTFLEITRKDVFELSDKHHDFERLGRVVTTKTMLTLRKRIISLQFETAQQKYENLINNRPDITQRVPLTHIASYLGITLETLSRIRNQKIRI